MRKLTPEVANYVRIWQSGPTDAAITSLGEMIRSSPEEANLLKEMEQDNIVLDVDRSRSNRGYFVLITQDPTVAIKHGLHPENEILFEE